MKIEERKEKAQTAESLNLSRSTNSEKVKRFNLDRLPVELHTRLKVMSVKSEVPMQTLIIKAIEYFLVKYEEERIKRLEE